MKLLSPRQFGKIPDGLPDYHRSFLEWVKETVEILTGQRQSQNDTTTPARSKAVTFADLKDMPSYADNATAIANGLQPGDLYRTVDVVKVVHT